MEGGRDGDDPVVAAISNGEADVGSAADAEDDLNHHLHHEEVAAITDQHQQQQQQHAADPPAGAVKADGEEATEEQPKNLYSGQGALKGRLALSAKRLTQRTKETTTEHLDLRERLTQQLVS